MDFSLGGDRQMLVDTLTRYFRDNAGFEKRLTTIESGDGFDRELWSGLAELGVLGALFSEDAGGFGGTAFDVGAVFGEVGRALATGPFLATLLAGRLLAAGGETETLEGVIAGETIVTFAQERLMEGSGAPADDVVAAKDGDGWTLAGAKGVVDYLGAASHAVVIAQADDEEAAFLLPLDGEGVTAGSYKTIDGGTAGELRLDGATATRLAIGDDALAGTRAMGLVAIAWEAVAVMEKLRDQTLDYLRTRTQFGVPIGKFQALQHRMATVALEIEQARSAAINAAAHFDKEPAERDRYAAAAKYTIGKVGSLTAEEAIQLHGGIGMTWELPLSHYAKRLVILGHVLGDEDEHLARYIALSRAA